MDASGWVRWAQGIRWVRVLEVAYVPRWTHLCGLLWGCSQGADHPQQREGNASGPEFTSVLEQVLAQPHDTAALCSVLNDPELHGECLSIGAERLAIQQEGNPQALCEVIQVKRWQDECFFIVAEKGDDPSLCASAGRFTTDCLMHTWTRKINREIPKTARPGHAEPEWANLAQNHGFAEDPAPGSLSIENYWATCLPWIAPVVTTSLKPNSRHLPKSRIGSLP